MKVSGATGKFTRKSRDEHWTDNGWTMNRTDNVMIAMIERQMLGEQFSRIRMPITTTR